jgi:hypothetical protein
MDIAFVPLNRNRDREDTDDNEELQLSTRNFYSSIPALFNLASQSQSQSQLRQSMPSIYALDYFKHTKPVDQSIENIKEFTDNFTKKTIKI